ncbi:unnamed protein product [Phytomonas sp. EM1]|nr:unnamed protein product [Phytomonas sp. EM1]|eukprot:CCW61734.1 unnamed protein product [Phytomonas sp. isolate EM1]
MERQGQKAWSGTTLDGANKSTRKRCQPSRHSCVKAYNKGTSTSSRSDNNSIYNSFEAFSLSVCSRQFSLHSVKSVSCMPIPESVQSCSLTCFADYSSSRVNATNWPRCHMLRPQPMSGCSDSFARHYSESSTPQIDRMNLCKHSNKACSVDHTAARSDSVQSVLPSSPRWQQSLPEKEKSNSSRHSTPRCQKSISLALFPQGATKNNDTCIGEASTTQKNYMEVTSSCDTNTHTDSGKPINSQDFLDQKDKDTKEGLSDGICTGGSSTEIMNSPTEDKLWHVWQAKKEMRVGRGSSGDVYRGIDLDTGRTIAIKEILVPKDFSKDMEKQLQLLEREINVMRKLRHPNIINYLGAAREGNCIKVFMEYVPGGTLGDQLRCSGPLSEDQARHYTKQLLSGLEYLHNQRIVHRDLKGDNLFLHKDNVLKLGDFGTSKELATTLVTDSVAGTPNFMAPEVIACSGHSYAADIWSVGCCVVEMLVGKPPFSSLDNHMAVMFAIIKGKVGDEMPAHASASARDFFRACTQHEPKDRCSARELQTHPWILGGEPLKRSSVTSRTSVVLKKSKKRLLNSSEKSNTRGRDRSKKSQPRTVIPPLPVARNALATTVVPSAPRRRRSPAKDTNPIVVHLPRAGSSGVADLDCGEGDVTSSGEISSRIGETHPMKAQHLTRGRVPNHPPSSMESMTLSSPSSIRSPGYMQPKVGRFSMDSSAKLPLRGIVHRKGNCRDAATKIGSCLNSKAKKTSSVAGYEYGTGV